jgi:hypothetical protein
MRSPPSPARNAVAAIGTASDKPAAGPEDGDGETRSFPLPQRVNPKVTSRIASLAAVVSTRAARANATGSTGSEAVRWNRPKPGNFRKSPISKPFGEAAQIGHTAERNRESAGER